MNHRASRLSFVADGVAYFCTAALAVLLTRFNGGVAFIWIATAMLIGRLAATPRKHWAPILIGCGAASFVATTLFGLGGAAAPALAIINLAEAVIAALMLRRSRIPDTPFQSLGWLVNFVVAVGIVAPLVTAILGASVAHLTTGVPWTESVLRWYAGHALGNLTFTPIVTLLLRGDVSAWRAIASRRRIAEFTLLLLLVIGTTVAVFLQTTLPLLFLPMLPVIFMTFRVGRFGAAASVVVLALIGGGCTLMGYGPITLLKATTGTQLQFFQLYLAATVLTILPVAADLARRGKLFRDLRDSEARYRVLAEHSTDIILNLDVDGRIRFISPSVWQLGGYNPAELIGRPALHLIASEHHDLVRDAHSRTIFARGEPISVEYLALTRSGEIRWFETHARAVIADDGEVDGTVSIVRDIAARKALEARLTSDATTDPLTGLLNRRAFLSLLDRHGAEGGCVAVFDIDHFKCINDTWGHAAGDLVLQSFAQVARRTLRGGDHIARIGGEEFAVLLPGATLEQAAFVCDRLRRSLSETNTNYDQQSLRVTISGGVAPIVGAHEDVLKAADAALYRAKSAGRDRLATAA